MIFTKDALTKKMYVDGHFDIRPHKGIPEKGIPMLDFLPKGLKKVVKDTSSKKNI